MNAETSHRLQGLEPDNLLALLGASRIAEDARNGGTRLPTPRPLGRTTHFVPS